MKTVNGFILSRLFKHQIYDPKSGLKRLLIFSLNGYGLISLSRKAKQMGLILGLFLICNSLTGSINNDLVLEIERMAQNELIAISGDNFTTRDSNPDNVYRVPFILKNNLICVEANVNGREGLILLDTGMDQLILNQDYFRGKFSTTYISGVTNDMDYSQRKYVKLQMSNLPAHSYNAFIADLSSLEEALQIEVLGVCGVNFLQKFQWVIHYHQMFIEFFALDKSGDLLDKTTHAPPSETLQLEKEAGLLTVKIQIDGLPMNLALDTGTSSTVFDEKHKPHLLAEQRIFEQVKVFKIIGLDGIRKSITSYAIYGLQVGHTAIPPIQINFMPLNRINRGKSVKLDGIFNPLYLCHGTIGINWKKQQLYVWKDVPKRQESVVVRLDE